MKPTVCLFLFLLLNSSTLFFNTVVVSASRKAGNSFAGLTEDFSSSSSSDDELELKQQKQKQKQKGSPAPKPARLMSSFSSDSRDTELESFFTSLSSSDSPSKAFLSPEAFRDATGDCFFDEELASFWSANPDATDEDVKQFTDKLANSFDRRLTQVSRGKGSGKPPKNKKQANAHLSKISKSVSRSRSGSSSNATELLPHMKRPGSFGSPGSFGNSSSFGSGRDTPSGWSTDWSSDRETPVSTILSSPDPNQSGRPTPTFFGTDATGGRKTPPSSGRSYSHSGRSTPVSIAKFVPIPTRFDAKTPDISVTPTHVNNAWDAAEKISGINPRLFRLDSAGHLIMNEQHNAPTNLRYKTSCFTGSTYATSPVVIDPENAQDIKLLNLVQIAILGYVDNSDDGSAITCWVPSKLHYSLWQGERKALYWYNRFYVKGNDKLARWPHDTLFRDQGISLARPLLNSTFGRGRFEDNFEFANQREIPTCHALGIVG